MSLYFEQEPWKAITSAVGRAQGRVVAAIAYVGQDAHRLLPLKKGDVLVCDASDRAVQNGATNPKHLSAFLKAGVEVWSEEGLHAKVVVLPRRAFIGSANASNHSAVGLTEAVYQTADPQIVKELREFVWARGDRPLDEIDVARLTKMMPRRPRPEPVAREAVRFPTSVERLVLIGFSFVEWNSRELQVFGANRHRAASAARRMGSKVWSDPIALYPWEYDRIRDDDWVVQVADDGRAYSPGKVTVRVPYGTARMIWVARPPSTRRILEKAQAEAAGLRDVEVMKALPRASANRALAAFR